LGGVGTAWRWGLNGGQEKGHLIGCLPAKMMKGIYWFFYTLTSERLVKALFGTIVFMLVLLMKGLATFVRESGKKHGLRISGFSVFLQRTWRILPCRFWRV
jgi:hypothetical protein